MASKFSSLSFFYLISNVEGESCYDPDNGGGDNRIGIRPEGLVPWCSEEAMEVVCDGGMFGAIVLPPPFLIFPDRGPHYCLQLLHHYPYILAN